MPALPVPEPSEIAGRYQIVQRLGAGAFGTVYKAKDRILGRMVAIKTIRLEGLAAATADLQELTDRFKREAQVSAQLKHPNIVTIYDIGEADGTSYLAMEFIDGAGLDRIIAGGALLPERAALIAAQVADALDFAHRASVVHRDIKPANIMIEAGDRVKVTDFGIAKVTNSAEHLTMTGSLLGTPSYMSPEQARGGNIDGRSDLFAVGCVLYELLAGTKAFRGESITALIFKIITEEPPALRELSPDLPEEFVRIVSKALAKSPEARYQTGRDLASDLLALTRAGSSPTLREAESPTTPGLPVAPAIAPPTLVATARGAPPTLASKPAPGPAAPPPTPPGAATRAAAPRPQQRLAPPAPPAPRKHSSAGLLVGLAATGLAALTLAAAAGWYVLRSRPGDAKSSAAEAPGSAEALGAAPEATLPPPEPTSALSDDTRRAENRAAQEGSVPAALAAAATPQPHSAGPAATAANRPATTLPAPPVHAPVAEPAPAQPPAGQDLSFLDQEPPAVDGSEAGRRLAESFRSGGSSSSSFGTNSRLRARDRSPRDARGVESAAVATLRHLMNVQEAFFRKQGRYGTLPELKAAGLLSLDVPFQAGQFLRRSYRFELTLEGEGFRVSALPTGDGPRPFIGDASGFIRAGTE